MVSDKNLHVMKWLFENTKEPNCNIPWQRKESGGYSVLLNKGESLVRIDIARVQSRPVAVIVVKFSSPGKGEVCVQEPLQKVFSLRRRYDSEDDEELAQIMNNLLATIANQLARKTLRDMDTEEERRQEIYHRLLYGNTQNE
ncbi:MAG: hypothetical protein Q8R55_02280 [Candidatus Taylorbacteria bacterium]|nr:hypothetical protein [Candidatus Taylorbacteria bacterium]